MLLSYWPLGEYTLSSTLLQQMPLNWVFPFECALKYNITRAGVKLHRTYLNHHFIMQRKMRKKVDFLARDRNQTA